MTNEAVVAIYSPFAVTSLILLGMELPRRFKRREDYYFTLLCFCSVIWFGTNIFGLLTSSVTLAKFCINFVLIFVGFVPPILLLFVLMFYRVPYTPSGSVLLLLFVIPAINTILTLTSLTHTLVNAELEIVSMGPVRELRLVWGVWFWVHTAYCYTVSMILNGVILYQHFHLPKFYRLPSSMMIAGVSLTLAGNVVTLLQLLPPAMDPTLITMGCSVIFFNLAIINNNRSKFVRFSRRQIHHYLDLFILVLDERRQIVDLNRPAQEWLAAQGVALSGALTLDGLLAALVQTDWRVEDGAEGIFLHCAKGEFPVILNLRTREMIDGRGETIGSIAIFTDVTQNRTLIDRLEKKAGMDPLTGLPNRMAYIGTKNRLDASEHLPLSVVICDVNNLKEVNDTLGHRYGDKLLQVVAKTLEDSCPRGGFVGRIGGDEFVYLLPRTSSGEAKALVERVGEACARCDDEPFPVSAALGTATKELPEENLDDVTALADRRMYERKKLIKTNGTRQAGYP